MPTILKTTEGHKEVYNLLKDKFVAEGAMFTLHNLLWQVIVNHDESNLTDKETAFYHTGGKHKSGELVRTIERQKGYLHTYVMFSPDVSDTEADTVCFVLNEMIFGIDKDRSIEIIGSSF